MSVQDLIGQARDTLTVKRVFGDPYERDGVTFIPAAEIIGGAGGGEGQAPNDVGGTGWGGGFGVYARPAGAYVITDGQVRWQPAIDVNRIIAIASALVGGLVLRQLVRSMLRR